MRFRFLPVLFLVLFFSCKAKDDSIADVQNDLKQAMQDHLYSEINNDSSNVHYNVQDVTFFEDTDKFICEFKVHLKAKLFDTTGIMKANISKDFKKVDRLY